MMQTYHICSRSAAETEALGRALGAVVRPGTVFTLTGDLGAGKSVFSRGMARGLGITDEITSPTFIFFNDYNGGRLPFCHLDAYRLEGMDEEELMLIGLEDCFAAAKVVCAEWPQYCEAFLPQDVVEVQLKRGLDDARELVFTLDEQAFAELAQVLAER
jgi:tRNA threonylcarbamoyladenosine biosynthesis protein TsaE